MDVSKPHPFLNEFVFWAASLATPATRLKLLPLLPQVALESIDASVQVAWMEWETWQAMCEKTLTFYLVLHNLVATIVRILRLEVGWFFHVFFLHVVESFSTCEVSFIPCDS